MERLWSPTTHPNLASHWKKRRKHRSDLQRWTRFCRAQTEAKHDLWSISASFIFRHHVQERQNCTCLKKARFQSHSNVSMLSGEQHGIGRIAGMSSGSPLERSWWTALIRAMDRFHPVHSIQWSQPRECTWSGRRPTKIQATSTSVNMWPEMWSGMSKQAQQKRKALGRRKGKSRENARKLNGIYHIDPNGKEFNETLKNVRKKLELRMDSALPCNVRKTTGISSLKALTNPH